MEGLSTAVWAEMSKKRVEHHIRELENPREPRMPPSQPATGIQRLPPEIRLQIYYYCIPRKRVIDVANPRLHTEYFGMDNTLDFNDIQGKMDSRSDQQLDGNGRPDSYLHNDNMRSPISENDSFTAMFNYNSWDDWWYPHKDKNNIFLLSKDISDEALDVLYGENIFKLNVHGAGEYYIKNSFTDKNRQRIRYLLIIANPMDATYTHKKIFDDGLWCSILPHLKGLRIVAGQHVEADHYRNAPTLEQDMECWVNWIRPLLQCFGQHLSMKTNVQIDFNGREETRALAKECLPHGFQEVRCRHVGDPIFKRGNFSWESGYWEDEDYVIGSYDAYSDFGSD